MKKLLIVFFGPLVIATDIHGAATVGLNNYDSHMAIYLADGRTLAPADNSVYVELLGGPSAGQLGPVMRPDASTGIFTIGPSDRPGFFDNGVGLVPGVADGAMATFQLETWQGSPNPIPGQVAKTPTWTQATGSWEPSLFSAGTSGACAVDRSARFGVAKSLMFRTLWRRVLLAREPFFL